eukprot:SAG11_NODE_353_length_10348_cov_6.938335_5_plen_714_part_00
MEGTLTPVQYFWKTQLQVTERSVRRVYIYSGSLLQLAARSVSEGTHLAIEVIMALLGHGAPLLLQALIAAGLVQGLHGQESPASAPGFCARQGRRADVPNWVNADGDCSAQQAAGYCCPDEWPDCPAGEASDGSYCCDANGYRGTGGLSLREACCATCGVLSVCDETEHQTTLGNEWQSLHFTSGAAADKGGPCIKVIQAPPSKRIVLRFKGREPPVEDANGLQIFDSARAWPFGACPLRPGSNLPAPARSISQHPVRCQSTEAVVAATVPRSSPPVADLEARAVLTARPTDGGTGQAGRLWPPNDENGTAIVHHSDAAFNSTSYQVLVAQNPQSRNGWRLEWSFEEQASCSDGVQSPSETAVDCGGVCAACQPPPPPVGNCGDPAGGSTPACLHRCDPGGESLMSADFNSTMRQLEHTFAMYPEAACHPDGHAYAKYLAPAQLSKLIMLAIEPGSSAVTSLGRLTTDLASGPPHGPQLFIQGHPAMPAVDFQLNMVAGGAFVGRYLRWRDAADEQSSTNSSIQCSQYSDVRGRKTGQCLISIFRCIFDGLGATRGGAISLGSNSVMEVEASVFRGCHAYLGGAIAQITDYNEPNERLPRLVLTNVSFIRNWVTKTGRQLLIDGLDNSDVTGQGAGIYKEGGSLDARHCSFTGDSINGLRGSYYEDFVGGGRAIRLQQVRPEFAAHGPPPRPCRPHTFHGAAISATCGPEMPW